MKSLCPVRKTFDKLIEVLSSDRIVGRQCEQKVERMLKLLDDVSRGRAKKGHLQSIETLADTLLEPGGEEICIQVGHLVNSVLSDHRDILLSHVEAHYCPTGECIPLSPAPCQLACPANVDAPSYVALVGMGRYEEALEVLREDLPIPGCLGRICVHPCERACKRGEVDTPIAICQLKRVAFDKAYEQGLPPPSPTPQIYREKVAIIGSGPAGLSIGYFLVKMGYRPVIFESMPEPGGMLRWGIPAYRLPRHILRSEIDYIKALGVEIHTNVTFGKDITIEILKHQGFEAVFLGMGAWRSMELPIRGVEDNPNVIDCLSFLRHEELRQSMVGKKVVVIGGGNAAVDCVRTALRLDAEEVQLVYRRSRQEMPAHAEEVEAAEEEGALLTFLSSPIEVHTENGRISGLECIRNELSEPDATGRRRPVPIEGSEYVIPTDTVISAIGQQVLKSSLSSSPDLELSRNFLVVVNPETMETSVPGVFAGGDVVSGPATVVEAVAAGKKAADSIHRHLRGLPHSEYGPMPVRRQKVPVREILMEEKAVHTRPPTPTISLKQRSNSFDEVNLAFSGEDAAKEAKRCLRCDVCIRCGRCIEMCRDEMGVDAIHMAYVRDHRTEDTDMFRPAERCIGCGTCAVNCPTNAITMVDQGDQRVFRMCGAEMSRHELVCCDRCGEPFIPQKHLQYINQKADTHTRVKYSRDLCPICARQTRAETLKNQIPLY